MCSLWYYGHPLLRDSDESLLALQPLHTEPVNLPTGVCVCVCTCLCLHMLYPPPHTCILLLTHVSSSSHTCILLLTHMYCTCLCLHMLVLARHSTCASVSAYSHTCILLLTHMYPPPHTHVSSSSHTCICILAYVPACLSHICVSLTYVSHTHIRVSMSLTHRPSTPNVLLMCC